MAAVGQKDFVCNQGATFRRGLVWSDEDEVGVPLAGYTARMQVRPTVASTDVTIELTTENGRITLDEDVAGRLVLEISAEDTAALDAGTSRSAGKKYVYDLELEDGTGFVTRLLEGKFTIFPEVTRPEEEEETP